MDNIDLKFLTPKNKDTKTVLENFHSDMGTCSFGTKEENKTSVCAHSIKGWSSREEKNYYIGPLMVPRANLVTAINYQRFVLDPKESPYASVLSQPNVTPLAVKYKHRWFYFGISYRYNKKYPLNDAVFQNMLPAIRYYGEYARAIPLWNFLKKQGYSSEVAFTLFSRYSSVYVPEGKTVISVGRLNTNHGVFCGEDTYRVVEKRPRILGAKDFFSRREEDYQYWDIWREYSIYAGCPTMKPISLEDLLEKANRLQMHQQEKESE